MKGSIITTEQAIQLLERGNLDENKAYDAAVIILIRAYRKLRHEHSWCGQVDRMSGASDPNDRHEMGG